jgi:hypothetical protein
MFSQLKLYSFIFFTALLIMFSGCGGASSGEADVTPLSQDVPVGSATMPQATALPVEAPPETTPEPAPTSEPAAPAPESSDTLAMTFSISGGIVGFCDELTIEADGSYTLESLCNQAVITGSLDQADQEMLQAWRENFGAFQISSEDNPGGPDNMVTNLNFNGQGDTAADEQQQTMIYEWINGLTLRLRAQQSEASAPAQAPAPVDEPTTGVMDSGAICPEIGRPALLTIDVETPERLILIDPASQASCEIALNQPPAGRIVTAAGQIFYPVLDTEAQSLSVLQLKAVGEGVPLTFTDISTAEAGPFNFTISNDGAKIAWAQTQVDFESEPPLYRNSLWLANTDGSNQVTLLDQAENSELRFVVPVRFSEDGSRLYYTMQPDLGGFGLSGRLDNLYSVPVSGGEAQLIYSCPSEENLMCIGGFSLDGNFLTVLAPAEDALQIIDQSGGLINTIPLPASDYVERTAFGPSGDLAFVTATLLETAEDQPPLPNPGYLTYLAQPYTGEAQTLLSDNSVGTLWGWLDESRLIFGQLDEAGQPMTALLSLDGQVTVLTPNVVVGVMR